MAQARGPSSVLHCVPLSEDTEGMVSTVPRDLPEAAGAKRSNGAEYQEIFMMWVELRAYALRDTV